MLSSLTLFDDFFDYRKPSIYVVSDAQLSAWKRTQAEREIIELDRLIDSHQVNQSRDYKLLGMHSVRIIPLSLNPLLPKLLLINDV